MRNRRLAHIETIDHIARANRLILRGNQPVDIEPGRVRERLKHRDQLLVIGAWLTGLAHPQYAKVTLFWIFACLLITIGRVGARVLCRRRLPLGVRVREGGDTVRVRPPPGPATAPNGHTPARGPRTHRSKPTSGKDE